MKLDKSTWIRIGLIVGGAVVLAWLLWNLSVLGGVLAAIWGILFPFIVGFIFAFLLNLPMRFIERKLFRGRGGRAARPVSFLLTVVLVLAVIVLVMVLLVPQLVQTVQTLVRSMPGYIRNVQTWAEPYLERLPELEEWLDRLNINWQALFAQLSEWVQSGAGNLLSSAVGVATSIISGVTSLAIGLIFTCYLLLDKERLSAHVDGLLMAYLPKKRFDKLMEVARLTQRTYSKFVSGQFIEALIVTAIYTVVLSVGGFDYSLLISVLIGACSLIPMIGIIIGCAIGALLLLVSMGLWRALIFLLVCFIVQQIEGNLIYPHVVGNSVGLPPIWTLVAVTVGGGLAGIFGMLFFIPLFSVLYQLLQCSARRRLVAKGLAAPAAPQPEPDPAKRGWLRRRPRKKK